MIKLVIFDMDGTVFESYLDWKRIKKEMNIKDGNILKDVYRNGVPDVEKLSILENFEKENTLKTKPKKGISGFLSFLRSKKIKTALITNNNRKNTDFLLNKYNMDFDVIVTRELKLWKPDPDPFLYVMNIFDCKKEETVAIGDSHYDIITSQKANIPVVFIFNDKNVKGRGYNIKDYAKTEEIDVVFFDNYSELQEMFHGKFN